MPTFRFLGGLVTLKTSEIIYAASQETEQESKVDMPMARIAMPNNTSLASHLDDLDIVEEERQMWLWNGFYIQLNDDENNPSIVLSDGDSYHFDDNECAVQMRRLAIARWYKHQEEPEKARRENVRLIEVDSTRESLEARNGDVG